MKRLFRLKRDKNQSSAITNTNVRTMTIKHSVIIIIVFDYFSCSSAFLFIREDGIYKRKQKEKKGKENTRKEMENPN